MWGSIFKGAIVGAIIAFLWSAISWIALPWHKMTLERFHDEQAVVDTMMESAKRQAFIFCLMVLEINRSKFVLPLKVGKHK